MSLTELISDADALSRSLAQEFWVRSERHFPGSWPKTARSRLTIAGRIPLHHRKPLRWSYQTFVESRDTSLCTGWAATTLLSRFRLFRADDAKVAAPSGAVFEGIDVVGNVRYRIIAARIHTFLVQATEERLDESVVPADALSAHAWLEVIGAAEVTKASMWNLTT